VTAGSSRRRSTTRWLPASSDAGPLALIGSGEFTSTMRSVDTLLLAHATHRRVLVVPTAAAADGPDAVAAVVRAGQKHFAQLGAEVVLSDVRSRRDALREQPRLDDVQLIYLAGGQVAHVSEVLVGTPYANVVVAAQRGGTGERGGDCAVAGGVADRAGVRRARP
jgi:cyanophycinase